MASINLFIKMFPLFTEECIGTSTEVYCVDEHTYIHQCGTYYWWPNSWSDYATCLECGPKNSLNLKEQSQNYFVLTYVFFTFRLLLMSKTTKNELKIFEVT